MLEPSVTEIEAVALHTSSWPRVSCTKLDCFLHTFQSEVEVPAGGSSARHCTVGTGVLRYAILQARRLAQRHQIITTLDNESDEAHFSKYNPTAPKNGHPDRTAIPDGWRG
jgi:hypothetical protein